MSELSNQVKDLVERICRNNDWRQGECINLIPSETTPSLLVKMCEISDPAGRYAEHRTMKGQEVYFYQGIDFIRDVEEEARREICKFFSCSQAELRTVSGQMANEVVFKGVVKFVNRDKQKGTRSRKLRAVLNNALTAGGHLSSQPMGALFNYVDENPETGEENTRNIPVLKDNPYRVDTEKLGQLLHAVKPELIVFGKSMFIYKEPVRFVQDILKDWNPKPVVMFDMAHVLGLYGIFQEPLGEGADVITGSTHKTFFGPQRGLVVSNMDKGTPFEKLWIDIKGRAFPGSTSNHHLGTLLALLMAAYEMNFFKKEYQNQVTKNAKAWARALDANGVKVEGDRFDGFTETHQVLVRVKEHGIGTEIARRLEDNNIVCNYQALPDDETFLEPSGIRTGVQEMTRFGMVEKDFEPLAVLFADCVKKNRNVKEEVKKLRSNFLDMKYCLPNEEAAPLAAKVLSTMLHGSDYAKALAEAMMKAK
jgi:glycine/serine hydroxymethyltransferase